MYNNKVDALKILVFLNVVYLVVGENNVAYLSIFPPLPVTVTKSDNTVCREHSDVYMDNLKNFTLWAHEMWDATAKSSTGILRGNVFQMGHFDQCLSANAPFPTQYCLATITANVPKPNYTWDHLSIYHEPSTSIFQKLYKHEDVSQQPRNAINMGWCIPSSCTILDMEESLNEYLRKIENSVKNNNITYSAKFSDQFCQTVIESQYYDNVDISFCFLAVILVLLVIIATIYDYTKTEEEPEHKKLKKSLSTKLILAFSARKNFLDLSKADEGNASLKILYGVRSVSILAIILDHRFGTFISSALLNFNYVESQYRSPIACLIFHGDLFVDTFFILSGLLVVYNLLNQFEKRDMNPGFIILLRYIRLTPVYAFVIFYYGTVFNYTGSGPLWKLIAGGDSKDCRNNWWTNLLYVNNYVNTDHMCMTHTWYLPCDFHYFIIATFLCMLIQKNRKIGLSSLLILTIISMAIPFALTIIYQRPGLMHFYPEFLTGPKVYPDFQLMYSKSHTRATPYFIGMFAGYIYHSLKGSNKHICRTKSFTIVFVSLCLMLISVFSGMVFYNPYHEYNALESATYAALHRPAWAIGSMGLLYVGSFGHGSFFRKVLTWSPWIPISKLVYGAYLTHMSFQLRSAARFMSPKQVSYFDVMSLGLSDMVLAFISALCLFLMIEAPFRKIFRELMFPHRKHSPETVRQDTTVEENIVNNNYQDSRL